MGSCSDLLRRRLSNLLCVKSIVTLMLTSVFGYLTVTDRVSGQDFLTIFSVVIAFYFGTQSQRNGSGGNGQGGTG